MTKALETFILKARPHCEMPDENGAPICISKATHILEVTSSQGYCYTIAACDDCARYVRKHRHERTASHHCG
jgi:hypothetical protein